MRATAALLVALPLGCVPQGAPPATNTSNADAARTDADSALPSGCNWAIGDLGDVYFPPSGEGFTGIVSAGQAPGFRLYDMQGTLDVTVFVPVGEARPGPGSHDLGALGGAVSSVARVTEAGIDTITTTSDVTGTMTVGATFLRVDFTALFEEGTLTACIEGDPLW